MIYIYIYIFQTFDRHNVLFQTDKLLVKYYAFISCLKSFAPCKQWFMNT